jgi:exopolysaccharide biosynthesis polyprenyl glycosylphosphotransferase
VDTLAILTSGLAAFFLRRLLPNLASISTQGLFTVASLFWVVLIFFGLVMGLYRGAYHINTHQQYFLAAKSYAYSVLVLLGLLYVLQFAEFPRKFTFLFFLLLPLFFIVGRSALKRFNLRMQEKGFGVQNALIVGYENGGMEVFRRFKGFPELGYKIKGVMSDSNDEGGRRGETDAMEIERSEENSPPRYSLSMLETLVKKERIDSIFIPSTTFVGNGSAELMAVCKQEGIKLKVLSPGADQLLKLAHVYDIAGITLYAPPRFKIEFLRKATKRGFDILCSLIILVILTPVFLVAAAAIVIESGFPVLFKQVRSSTKNGRTFQFYKFRSMVENADEMKDNLLPFNESDGALFKMKNDPRTTKVGKIIRRFSIDEFPQLLNVLRGDMSLVGPRPLPVSDFEKMQESQEFWEAIKSREKVRPGVTGLWQISGRSHLGFREMLLLDAYYIDNQSILLDLEILFETIPVVLLGRGAY